MKSKKLITFKRDKLVKSLDEKSLDIANCIIIESQSNEEILDFFIDELQDWDDYRHDAINEAFDNLKRRRKAYYLGQIVMLLNFIEDFDVFVDKRSHGFLRYMSSLEV